MKAALLDLRVRRILRDMGASVPAEILAALERGNLILTSNDRAARVIRHSWDNLQSGRDQRSWEPAKVLSWRTWTHLLWGRMLLDGRASALLLTVWQEKRIWEKVIAAGSLTPGLSRPESLATLAATAWQRLCTYNGQEQLRRAMPHLQGDARQFALWVQAFDAMCRRESLLSASLLETELVSRVALQDVERFGNGMLLLGFDRLTPAQSALLDSLRSLEATIEFAEKPRSQGGLLVTAPDETEELRGCARWIRNQLREAPQARFALIVNDLEAEMGLIESVLREHLSPELEDIAADSDQIPFEFSLGRPLMHEPMVQTALDLIHWTSTSISVEKVSRLLLSPYFAHSDEEAAARAEFDACSLRQQMRLRPDVAIDALLRELRDSSGMPSRLPLLRRVLEEMNAIQARADLLPRGFGSWSEWIRRWLVRARWGESGSALGSREYQLRERWEDALDHLAALDFLGEQVEFDEAVRTLSRITRDLIFAPESRNLPVQVLGPLEAAGEQFDGLWVLRAGEMAWPPSAAALPLLPWSLQREAGMPGTDSEQERRSAERCTQRLTGSASNVVFSFAQATSSGGRQRAAAVVRDLGLQALSIIDLTGSEEARSLVELERVPDSGSVAPLPDITHRGGVRILELQAACGFRAFAEMRLGSSEPAEREIGLNATERGNVVHTALQAFWSTVGGQQELRAMGQVEREQAIGRAVLQGLSHAQHRRADLWDDAYLETQQVRLANLLSEWIDLELQRPEFTVVAQEESRQNVSIGPLRLSLRVDRIDLVDGQQVILDYKTGGANTSEWLGDRPDSPQVPLYAILASEGVAQASETRSPLGAVGFGQVRAGKDLKLRGFEATPGILSSPRSGARPPKMDAENFEDQVARWHQVLEQLATEFAEGDARVRPKQYPSTCERCSQRVLCRLDASSFEESLEDPIADEDDDQHG